MISDVAEQDIVVIFLSWTQESGVNKSSGVSLFSIVSERGIFVRVVLALAARDIGYVRTGHCRNLLVLDAGERC